MRLSDVMNETTDAGAGDDRGGQPTDSICSSASARPPWCRSTRTASAICRCARRCWSGISARRRSPAATSTTTSATRTTSRCATSSKRSSRTPPASIEPTLDEIARYTKLFWINTGPYNNLTARKFVLACTPAAFAAAAHAAARAGARFPLQARRDARRAARAPAADVLRSRRRSDRHQQDAARRQGHPHRQREQPLRRRDDGGSRGVRGEAPAELAAREARRPAGRRGLPRRRPLRRADRRDRRSTSRRRCRSRPSRWRRRCARSSRSTAPARTPIARRTTSPGCRTRRRRSTRSTASSRSTSTRAASRARGKRSSSTSTSEKTSQIQTIAAQRAVVRRPHAVGSEVPQGRRPRRHRQRHRRRHRDRRLGADHAGRHQPAERSDDPRALRQQVGVAVERQRGVRPLDAAGVPQRVLVDAGGSRARRSGGARSPAS